MKFSVNHFNAAFLVSFLPSDSKTNYQSMAGYDYRFPIVYDSLPILKKDLKIWVHEAKLSDSERYWLKEDIKELSIEFLIDQELASYSRLERILMI